MDSDNYYSLLGINASADESEIRRAYFEKARQFHPDAAQADSEQFDLVKLAYKQLIDPKKRASYDSRIGIQQSFGKSQLSEDFDWHSSQNNSSLSLRRGPGFFSLRYFIEKFRSLLAYLRDGRLNIADKNEGPEHHSLANEAVEPNSLSLAVYSEESFPLGMGESISVKFPEDSLSLQACSEVLRESLLKYSIVSQAVIIEARLASMPSEMFFIVLLSKHKSNPWGIDNLQFVEIKNYPDHMPGLLLCSIEQGPFSEAVKSYGIEIFPDLALQKAV